ncbi:MAG: hypothetical protein QOD47_1982, partial [Gemmatimonadaceae bacterium]|nr:hypothetical protein [Gemmatimonadaceae bacterium]
ALAPPGVTGDKVPGFTRLGPNVPAPFFKPSDLLSDSAARNTAKMPDSSLLREAKVRLDSAQAKAKADSARGPVIR